MIPENGVRDAGVVVAHTNEASPLLHQMFFKVLFTRALNYKKPFYINEITFIPKRSDSDFLCLTLVLMEC